MRKLFHPCDGIRQHMLLFCVYFRYCGQQLPPQQVSTSMSLQLVTGNDWQYAGFEASYKTIGGGKLNVA